MFLFRFTRTITGCDCGQDFNLNSSYYALYGRSDNIRLSGRLSSHTVGGAPNPSISTKKVNPVTDSGIQEPDSFPSIKRILIQTHGVLMLFAWPLFASVGIFFPAYMRPALPKGEWFHIHRAFMIFALLIADAGFILVFVAQLRNRIPGLIDLGSDNRKRTAHFVIGIIVTFLQILNPIIAGFRCNPSSDKRWIFKLFHGYFVGLVAEVLAYVNVGLGITIFTYTYSEFSASGAPIWLYIAYVILVVILFAVALPIIKKCVETRKTKKKSDNSEEIQLQSREERNETGYEEPAKHFSHLWISLGLYVGLTLAVVIVLGVLIVI